MARSWYPVIDYTKCSSCRTCVDFCPHDVYALGEQSEPVVVYPDGCVFRCRNCAKRCPAGAISYYGDSAR